MRASLDSAAAHRRLSAGRPADRPMRPIEATNPKCKKVKVGFFYSTTYSGNAATSRAVQSQEVAVDWQEPMVLRRKLRPSIACVNVQLDPRYAASKHTTAPINYTRPSPRKLSPDGAARARKHTIIITFYNNLYSSGNQKCVFQLLSRFIVLVSYIIL